MNKNVKIAPSILSANFSILGEEIKRVLNEAIEMGGTTLRDFTYYNEVRQIGYFKQKLFVYGRSGEECKNCSELIKERIIGINTSPAAAGAGTPAKKLLVQTGRLSTSSIVLNRASRSAIETLKSTVSIQPKGPKCCIAQR